MALKRHTPTLTGNRVYRAMYIDVALLPHFGDAITELTLEYVWKEVGDSVADILESCKESIEEWYDVE